MAVVVAVVAMSVVVPRCPVLDEERHRVPQDTEHKSPDGDDLVRRVRWRL